MLPIFNFRPPSGVPALLWDLGNNRSHPAWATGSGPDWRDYMHFAHFCIRQKLSWRPGMLLGEHLSQHFCTFGGIFFVPHHCFTFFFFCGKADAVNHTCTICLSNRCPLTWLSLLALLELVIVLQLCPAFRNIHTSGFATGKSHWNHLIKSGLNIHCSLPSLRLTWIGWLCTIC